MRDMGTMLDCLMYEMEPYINVIGPMHDTSHPWIGLSQTVCHNRWFVGVASSRGDLPMKHRATWPPLWHVQHDYSASIVDRK